MSNATQGAQPQQPMVMGAKKLNPWDVVSNDVNISQMAGGVWKKKIFDHQGKASRETGRKKGIRPNALQKYMCRRNRSYKNPLYERTMASLGQRKGKQG